jgi:hypothetical protein
MQTLDLTKVSVSKDYKDGLAETKTYGASSVSSKKPLNAICRKGFKQLKWFRKPVFSILLFIEKN